MSDRGTEARSPWQVPPGGWKAVLLRVKDEVARDNVALAAAGVAFYWLLAIFPLIVAAVGIWGLVADPADAGAMLDTFGGAIPEEGRAIVEAQLADVAGSATAALGFGTVLGILTALFSASAGTKALMSGLNIAYNEAETRSFIRYNLLAVGLLLLGMLVALVAAAGVIVAPAILGVVGLGEVGEAAVRWGRWPLVLLGFMVFLAVAYRFGPARDHPQWSWTSPGAVLAAVLWLVGSGLFSLYVSQFGTYAQTYGSIAGVVVLMLWFFVTAFVILLGGELNGELERQTRHDTTVGEPEPVGERGAAVADEYPPGEGEPA